MGNEGQSRKADPKETNEEKQLLDAAFVAIERYQRYQELFNKLHAMRYRFMAQFGAEGAKPFDELRAQVNSVLSASHMLSMMWTRNLGRRRGAEGTEQFHMQVEKFENVYWEGFDDDPIKPEIDRIIREIEATCRAIITSKRTLFSLLNAKLTGDGPRG